MARVLVTGGSGHMGRRAVRALLDDGHDVTVADRRPAHDGRARFVEVDATDDASLLAAMRERDVTVNFVGPYYRFGTRVAEAAIRAGCPYVDVCDDADVTEALLALDERARDAGVALVVGAGMSPGVLNAVTQAAAADFDEVDELLTAWVVDERTESGTAPLDHFFHGMADEIPIWDDGDRRVVKPFTDASAEAFPFPEPVGTVEVRDIGHPETVTLPRVIPARSVRNKGALLPVQSAPIFRTLAGIGLLSDAEVEVGGTAVRARDFVVAYLTQRHNERLAEGAEDLSAMGVRVTGRRGGAEAVRHVAFSRHLSMADSTALPAVAATDVVLGGSIEPGVHGPEALGPPRWFERIVHHAGDSFDDLAVWDGDDAGAARTLSLIECGLLGEERAS